MPLYSHTYISIGFWVEGPFVESLWLGGGFVLSSFPSAAVLATDQDFLSEEVGMSRFLFV